MTTVEFGLNLIAAHLRNYDDPNIVFHFRPVSR